MARTTRQLEFSWTSWLRRVKALPSRRRAPSRLDKGLSAWCAEQAAELMLFRLKRRVSVQWNGRMTSSAGRAIWPDCLIELNPRLRQLGEDQIWHTLRHELAHLVAYERCGRRRIAPHGPEWRQACADLGIPGESPYHDLPLPTRQVQRRHLYICRHCRTELERVRPLRRAVACYECCRKYNQGRYDDRFRMVKQSAQA